MHSYLALSHCRKKREQNYINCKTLFTVSLDRLHATHMRLYVNVLTLSALCWHGKLHACTPGWFSCFAHPVKTHTANLLGKLRVKRALPLMYFYGESIFRLHVQFTTWPWLSRSPALLAKIWRGRERSFLLECQHRAFATSESILHFMQLHFQMRSVQIPVPGGLEQGRALTWGAGGSSQGQPQWPGHILEMSLWDQPLRIFLTWLHGLSTPPGIKWHVAWNHPDLMRAKIRRKLLHGCLILVFCLENKQFGENTSYTSCLDHYLIFGNNDVTSSALMPAWSF